MLIKYIVYITSNFKTIKLSEFYRLYFEYSKTQMTPVRIYGEPFANKFCAVNIFGNIIRRQPILPVIKYLHVLGCGLRFRQTPQK